MTWTAHSVVNDPRCVKTREGRGCAEWFSQLSTLDRGCQQYLLSERHDRDGASTRKLDDGVFTRPGPRADHHQNFEVLIRRRAPRCCGNTAWGGSKMTSGRIDIEGDSLTRGRADRVERKTLRNSASVCITELVGRGNSEALQAVRCLPSIFNWALSSIETGHNEVENRGAAPFACRIFAGELRKSTWPR
jgi:hypothetical protein